MNAARRLSTEDLVDAAFAAVLGGDQELVDIRFTLQAAIDAAVSAMPARLPGRLRRIRVPDLRLDGRTFSFASDDRALIVNIAGTDGTMSVVVEPWRDGHAGNVRRVDMTAGAAVAAAGVLARAWRHADLKSKASQ